MGSEGWGKGDGVRGTASEGRRQRDGVREAASERLAPSHPAVRRRTCGFRRPPDHPGRGESSAHARPTRARPRRRAAALCTPDPPRPPLR
eukprot:7132725-Prymnesium_polylepis.2